MKKVKRAQTNKRLRNGGFARTRAGYLPPGCLKEEIEKASKLKKVLKMNKSIKPPPEPNIRISPLLPDGGVNIGFSQDMLAPKKGTKLRSKIYNNFMDISLESKNDGSEFKGSFGSSKKQRMLAATDVEGDARTMAFSPKINGHNSTGFSVKVEFDDPEAMSVGGSA